MAISNIAKPEMFIFQGTDEFVLSIIIIVFPGRLPKPKVSNNRLDKPYIKEKAQESVLVTHPALRGLRIAHPAETSNAKRPR